MGTRCGLLISRTICFGIIVIPEVYHIQDHGSVYEVWRPMSALPRPNPTSMLMTRGGSLVSGVELSCSAMPRKDPTGVAHSVPWLHVTINVASSGGSTSTTSSNIGVAVDSGGYRLHKTSDMSSMVGMMYRCICCRLPRSKGAYHSTDSDHGQLHQDR